MKLSFYATQLLRQKLSFCFLVFGLSLWSAASTSAAPGDLDPTFGNNGKVFSELPNGRVYSIAIQPDGKILAAGTASRQGGFGFDLVRYKTDGTFDPTFGTNGKATVLFGVNVSINAIAVQPDGKIVVAGYGAITFGPTASDFLLSRFLPDGSLDTTFGDGGKVFTDFNNLDNFAHSMIIQTDGKIVVAGRSGLGLPNQQSDFALARYNINGTLDTGFGNGGKVLTDLTGNFDDFAYSVLNQPDGKIIAAGFNFTTPVANFALVRYNTDGSIDNSFGMNGKVLTSVGNFSRFNERLGAALQANGKIVVAGKGYDENSNSAFIVHRYDSNGKLDETFGNGGKVTTRFGSGEDTLANAVAIQPNGRIIVSGSYRGPENNFFDFALARYNMNGSLDDSFGTNGKLLTDFFSLADLNYAVALQQDGKIVAAGYSLRSSFSNGFALVRYVGGPFNLLQTPTFTVSDSTGSNNGFYEPGENLTLSVPLSNNTGFDAVSTTLQVAGGGSANYGTISDISIVSRKVSYTVPANIPCGNFLTLTFNVNSSLGAETFTRQIVIGAPNITFLENFDSVTAPALPAGWTASTVQNGINFVTTSTNPDTAPNSAFALDPTTVGGGTDLTSPSTPIAAAAATLSFRNRYDTEVGWDGGVLEISIAGGAFQDILAAGGSFIEGGYNDTLGANGVNNPLAGRRAWSGNSNGYITTIVQLPASAVGQSVRFRWRFGADDNTGGPGWNIDTIKVIGSYNCSMVNTRRIAFDFDGDGKSDVSVFRPDNGVWYLQQSANGFTGVQFGVSTDKLVPADFDGDGKTDIAVFRDGVWYWLNSSNNSFSGVQFGQAGDIPIPADYSGDGRAELAVFRAGSWYTFNLANNQFQGVQFGISTDKPVAADYDGDGKADIAVVRQASGVSSWYILGTSQGFYGLQFGTDTDKLVPADYDGDGKTDVAVYRSGIWYVLRSTQGFYGVQFGAPNDVPVAADYDGDGKADIAVFRDGFWYMLRSQQGFGAVQFGQTNDRMIPAAYVP